MEQMYQNPDAKDTDGEKSFPIRDGRYRACYKITVRPNHDFDITFLDVDHNKQSNLDRFPAYQVITFDESDW